MTGAMQQNAGHDQRIMPCRPGCERSHWLNPRQRSRGHYMSCICNVLGANALVRCARITVYAHIFEGEQIP